ncbi:SixA phosphatase family protein [Suttonella ornithocola]|uniref:Phosphohistidine phosphatase n=1 Tax=Suttonella ornithocola TaxID=279832 RepID=A0A380MMP4_9GAMM|nr:histidine phosphatase family protein [Suttonella ornithocola]SUO93572.1 phosphohistidine phosphatase [Suttonella ornithocola]
MKNRIFWRHAQADWGMDDLSRALTKLGHQQAHASANWLQKQEITFPIYCSEALRGQQTAQYYDTPIALAGLNPDGAFSVVEKTLNSITDDSAIIVGHLPWIGQIVGGLLETNGYIAVNYSEVFWLTSEDESHWQLKAHFLN